MPANLAVRECLDFLKEAVKRDERYKLMAMEDEDLAEIVMLYANLVGVMWWFEHCFLRQ